MRAEEAQAALAGSRSASGRLAGRTRWMVPFYLVLGLGFGGVVLTVGLADLTTIFVTTGVFFLVVTVFLVGAVRRGVVRRRMAHLHLTVMLVGSVLYTAALLVGLQLYPGVTAYWTLAAVVVAAPFVVGAGAVVASRTASLR